jgi:hypothetical protein
MNGQADALAVLLLEKISQHKLDNKSAGPQSLSGQGADEQNICPRHESKPRSPAIQPVF